jgi:hypothetical protein
MTFFTVGIHFRKTLVKGNGDQNGVKCEGSLQLSSHIS